MPRSVSIEPEMEQIIEEIPVFLYKFLGKGDKNKTTLLFQTIFVYNKGKEGFYGKQ